MKIYTKTGDGGLTSLIGGTKVRKDHVRVAAYGTVDELNSWVGLLGDLSTNANEKDFLLHIQDRLFVIGSHLASDPERSSMKLPALYDADIVALEQAIDKLDEHLPALKHFILPGGHPNVSYCHIARSVCRRAEREVTALEMDTAGLAGLVISYLNRLSDYLFTLARDWSMLNNAPEIAWLPEKSDF